MATKSKRDYRIEIQSKPVEFALVEDSGCNLSDVLRQTSQLWIELMKRAKAQNPHYPYGGQDGTRSSREVD